MFAYIYSDGELHLFAITLQRIATLTAPGSGESNYTGQLLARQMDWLTCLINLGDERSLMTSASLAILARNAWHAVS